MLVLSVLFAVAMAAPDQEPPTALLLGVVHSEIALLFAPLWAARADGTHADPSSFSHDAV